MASVESLRCPGCGEFLGGARDPCARCGAPTTGVRFAEVVRGAAFQMPALCSCCLTRTTNQWRIVSRPRRFAVVLDVPRCGMCGVTSMLAALVRFLCWTAGFLVMLVVTNRNVTHRTPAYSIVLFGGYAAIVVLGYLVTRWLPPFRRLGHTLRCRSVDFEPGRITCHSRHFAKIVSAAPIVAAPPTVGDQLDALRAKAAALGIEAK